MTRRRLLKTWKQKRDPVAALEALKSQYRTESRGHHQKVRLFICRAFVEFLALRKDSAGRVRFYKRAHVPLGKRKPEKLAEQVMAFLAGAKSESQRQQAWKRARAVSFLHEQKVSTADLAKEIAKRGGIERIVKEAARKSPRRPKLSKPYQIKPVHATSKVVAATDSDPDRLPTRETNDEDLPLTITIRASDLDQLRELETGSEVRLIAKRLPDSHPDRRIVRIVRVRKSK